MPVLLEKNQEFEVVLDCDVKKENQPKFYFRALSCRDWRNIAKIADTISEKNTDEAIDAIFSMLKLGLTSWDLVNANGDRIEFNPDELDGLVTLQEANELLEKFKNQGVGAAERKN